MISSYTKFVTASRICDPGRYRFDFSWPPKKA